MKIKEYMEHNSVNCQWILGETSLQLKFSPALSHSTKDKINEGYCLESYEDDSILIEFNREELESFIEDIQDVLKFVDSEIK